MKGKGGDWGVGCALVIVVIILMVIAYSLVSSGTLPQGW